MLLTRKRLILMEYKTHCHFSGVLSKRNLKEKFHIRFEECLQFTCINVKEKIMDYGLTEEMINALRINTLWFIRLFLRIKTGH